MKKRNVWVTLALAITLTAMSGCGSASTADTAKTEKQNIETSADTETDEKDKTVQNTEGEDSAEKSEVIKEQTPAVKDEKPSGTDKKEETNETKNTADDKKDTSDTKEGSSNPSKDTKPSTGNADNSPGNQNNKSADKPVNKPTSTPTQTPQPTPEIHTHNWVVTETIPHAEEGHWETKVIKEAWTEEIKGWVTRCSVCQLDMTNYTDDEIAIHITSGCYGRYYTAYETIDTIPHEAETEDVWVVDKEAYTETKYGCSCGATK